MKTLPIIHIFAAAVRRSFNSLTAGFGLLHYDGNWKAEFIEHNTQSLEETTVRLLAACVRGLKTPCTLHLFTNDERIARACTSTDQRGPAKTEVWQAWKELDDAIREGKHKVFGTAQARPDSLLIQACTASALSVSFMSADDARDALAKTAPHLFAVELILQQEPNFPWAVRLVHATPQYTEADGTLPPFIGDPRADRTDNMVTPGQLILIRQAGRATNLRGEALEEECLSKLRCRTEDLNTRAAQWLLEHLRKLAAGARPTLDHTATSQGATGTHNAAAP